MRKSFCLLFVYTLLIAFAVAEEAAVATEESSSSSSSSSTNIPTGEAASGDDTPISDDSNPHAIPAKDASVETDAEAPIEEGEEEEEEVIDLDKPESSDKDAGIDSPSVVEKLSPAETAATTPDNSEEVSTEKTVATASRSNTNATTTLTATGPFVDLFGPQLLSLEMIDERQAQLKAQPTNDALAGKKVVGLYFSADWCGPCRKFTPELVSFYDKINARGRGKNKNSFEIVWISRCRDVNAYGQYFAQMGSWLALPPDQAMGPRGKELGDKYKVKGIPSLVLLDEYGNVITTDGRNKIPQDKTGIGFPWRNPLVTLYMTVLPRSLRIMLTSQVASVKDKMIGRVRNILGFKKRSTRTSKTA